MPTPLRNHNGRLPTILKTLDVFTDGFHLILFIVCDGVIMPTTEGSSSAFTASTIEARWPATTMVVVYLKIFH